MIGLKKLKRKKKMKKKKHKSIWKRTLSFDEFVKIPKLPNNSIDIEQEYKQYLITRNYFILKKSLKRAIGKGEDYTDSFKKKWKIFDNLCWINNLPNDLR